VESACAWRGDVLARMLMLQLRVCTVTHTNTHTVTHTNTHTNTHTVTHTLLLQPLGLRHVRHRRRHGRQRAVVRRQLRALQSTGE